MIKYHEKDYGREIINKFRDYLWGYKQVEESTIDAYCIGVRSFCDFVGIEEEESMRLIDGISVRNFIEHLRNDEYIEGKKYLVTSINIKIVGMNQFLEFYKLGELKARQLKSQRRIFIDEKELLTELEIRKLLEGSKNEDEEMHCVIRSLAKMGLRASETKYITCESLNNGYINIANKGTYRQVPLPNDLKEELFNYCLKESITKGYVFLGKNGKPLNRTMIERRMKKIGLQLGISEKKLHPHSVRHFFALMFIKAYGKDSLSMLADILGHKSIETTRIYLKQTLSELSDKMTFEKLKIAP